MTVEDPSSTRPLVIGSRKSPTLKRPYQESGSVTGSLFEFTWRNQLFVRHETPKSTLTDPDPVGLDVSPRPRRTHSAGVPLVPSADQREEQRGIYTTTTDLDPL